MTSGFQISNKEQHKRCNSSLATSQGFHIMVSLHSSVAASATHWRRPRRSRSRTVMGRCCLRSVCAVGPQLLANVRITPAISMAARRSMQQPRPRQPPQASPKCLTRADIANPRNVASALQSIVHPMLLWPCRRWLPPRPVKPKLRKWLP